MPLSVWPRPRLQSPAHHLTLRWFLIVPFVLQIGAAVGIVGYLSLRNGQQAVNELSQRLRQEMTDRINQHLDSYFATPRQLTQTTADAIHMGLIDPQNLEQVGQFFWKQMQHYDVGYILFGSQSGDFAASGKYFDDGRITIDELSLRKHKTQDNYVYEADKEGNRLRQVDINRNYEFFKEPWYAQALKQQQALWTPIYQWETSPYPLSVAYSQPVRDRNNRLIGAIAVEQRLSQISDFLKRLKSSPSMRTFILERNGLLIATSSDTPPFTLQHQKPQRLAAQASPDPLIRSTAQYLTQRFPTLSAIQQVKHLEFSWEGQRQFVQVSPWRDRSGLDWLIVVTVAESDFMGQIDQNTHQTILLCAVALAIAILAGLYTSRYVTQPVMHLSQAASAIAQGKLELTIETQALTQTPVREVYALGLAFSNMAQQLRDSFAALARSNDDLEHRVERRTQELSQALATLQQTQSQLIHAEKMSSLGQMVAGFAHEINNPVSFIYGNLTYAEEYVDLLLKTIALYEEACPELCDRLRQQDSEAELDFVMQDFPKVLRSMREGAERISELVRGLQHFSRLNEAELKWIDIHTGLESTLLVLQHRLRATPRRSEIQIHKHYGDLPKLECYAGQLNQVFLSLLNNAIDALEDVEAPAIHITTQLRDDNAIEVRITDNGSGIPAAIQARIFDPFFTTKPVGQGQGLGLSIAYQIIVERHAGTLTCQSSAPGWTQFTMTLPLQQPEAVLGNGGSL